MTNVAIIYCKLYQLDGVAVGDMTIGNRHAGLPQLTKNLSPNLPYTKCPILACLNAPISRGILWDEDIWEPVYSLSSSLPKHMFFKSISWIDFFWLIFSIVCKTITFSTCPACTLPPRKHVKGILAGSHSNGKQNQSCNACEVDFRLLVLAYQQK